ncbi:putative glycolipid-binding domain-containing protein [Oceanicola sp. 502str15]|uniref:putative glycolipid-binding domain-containing protein n=1 Tax=Oceanicola sp. 502str15 TaxID=2696061 RepID=UPI002094E742
MKNGKIHAIARWHRLDMAGDDTCRLVEEPDGWMLCGHARYETGGTRAALDYIVRCTPTWESRSADITGLIDGQDVAWRLLRTDAGWQLGESPAALPDCLDIDLAFTPATNLLPLRRLAFDETQAVAAAWFREDEDSGRLDRLDQRYTPRGAGRFTYASPGFEAELEVHPSGFVTRYPGLWEGTVDAE